MTAVHSKIGYSICKCKCNNCRAVSCVQYIAIIAESGLSADRSRIAAQDQKFSDCQSPTVVMTILVPIILIIDYLMVGPPFPQKAMFLPKISS